MSAQSRHPFVLAAYGIALLINVTVVDGPFSAYKLMSRGIHRILDWLFVVALFAGAFVLDVSKLIASAYGALTRANAELVPS